MMKRPYIIALMLAGVYTGQVQAQEDNWFKKLFKKEDPAPKKTESSADSLNFLLDEYLKEGGNTSTDSTIDNTVQYVPMGSGKINVVQSGELIALNDSIKENPAPLKGYRIQIFFGKIDEAREARATFISAHPDAACNIDHIPPNFSVAVGNYTDKLEAYREMKALKKQYPAAILVPAEIEIP